MRTSVITRGGLYFKKKKKKKIWVFTDKGGDWWGETVEASLTNSLWGLWPLASFSEGSQACGVRRSNRYLLWFDAGRSREARERQHAGDDRNRLIASAPGTCDWSLSYGWSLSQLTRRAAAAEWVWSGVCAPVVTGEEVTWRDEPWLPL